MKKIIWLTLLIALIIVNGLAMIAEAITGTHIPIPFRLATVLAIVLVSMVFCGASTALKQAQNETPNAPKPRSKH